MEYERVVELLESEWSDDGFYSHIRDGRFDPAEFARALDKIKSLSFDEDAALPRRVVSLLWYLPLLMQWQRERVRDAGGDTAAYGKAIDLMTNEIERLLGVP
ncbi:MAG: hypothetical protein HOV81_34835 [Kofleriaceae bacterium]|nr:hypothetical protein [Kofleriaceae bacterium]